MKPVGGSEVLWHARKVTKYELWYIQVESEAGVQGDILSTASS